MTSDLKNYRIREFDPKNQPGFDANINYYTPAENFCIEIGCGVGMHPIKFAKSNPEKQLVAIEHTKNKFFTFRNNLREEEAPLENLLAIHGNAITWISKFISEESVDQYFLLYPNPWPKEKQKNQRWHQMPFMGYLIKTMKKGATLTLATNIPEYANEAKEYLQQIWGLDLISEQKVEATENQTYFPRTHFEKKYLERNEECYNLIFQKKSGSEQ